MGEPRRNYAPDLTGRVFGNLTVIEKLPPIVENGKKSGMSLCRCVCGRVISARNNCLKAGLTTSCGCKRREIAAARSRWHGATVEHKRLRNIFHGMTQRCYNPKAARFKRYGGRGIVICDEWRGNFGGFLEWALSSGYKENLTIDRINVDGPYSPENCRWADKITQANNTSTNRVIDFNGKLQTVAQWAREIGISPVTLSARFDCGWSIERALTTPKIIQHAKPKPQPKVKRILTDEELITKARQYKTRQAFKISEPTAYAVAYKRGIIDANIESRREPRVVEAIDSNGDIVLFQSVAEAARALHIQRSNIVQILHGRKNIIHGYRFRFAV